MLSIAAKQGTPFVPEIYGCSLSMTDPLFPKGRSAYVQLSYRPIHQDTSRWHHVRLIPQTLIPAFLRPSHPPQAVQLFETALSASREPVFYQAWRIPDTMAGRIEVLTFYLAVLHRRLMGVKPHGPELWRDTLDYAMAEIERGMREAGVGDVSVPKRMRRAAEAFYGRARAYGAALDENDPASLAEAVQRNVYGSDMAPNGAATAIAVHIVAIADSLDAQGDASFLRGHVNFPIPRTHELGHV